MRFSKRLINSESYAADSERWILAREKANAIGCEAPPYPDRLSLFTLLLRSPHQLSPYQPHVYEDY